MKWPLARLLDVCEIVVGRTPARANETYWGPGKPWLSIADMNQGRTIWRTKEQITSQGSRGGRLIEEGTVLLSFKLSIGKVARAGMPLYTNEAIAALPVKDKSVIDPSYLAWVLDALELADNSNRAAMGATLNKEKLGAICLPVPPLAVQHRIVALLDRAHAVLVSSRRVVDLLDELAHALFEKHFQGESQSASLEEMGADFVSGRNVVAGSDDSAHGVNRVLKVSAISTGRFLAGHSKRMPVEYRPPDDHRVRRGDILFGRASGSLELLGATAIVDTDTEDLFLPDKVWRLTVPRNSHVTPEYLFGVLRSKPARAFVRHNASGAAGVRNISKKKMLEYRAPLPALECQFAYDEEMRYVENQRARAISAIGVEAALFASLQARAFRGEL